jgi:hypothetical protein
VHRKEIIDCAQHLRSINKVVASDRKSNSEAVADFGSHAVILPICVGQASLALMPQLNVRCFFRSVRNYRRQSLS